jgi:hypothetical protein
MTIEISIRHVGIMDCVVKIESRDPNAVNHFMKYGITEHDSNNTAQRPDEPLIPQDCMLKSHEVARATYMYVYLIGHKVKSSPTATPGRGARLRRHANLGQIPCRSEAVIMTVIWQNNQY